MAYLGQGYPQFLPHRTAGIARVQQTDLPSQQTTLYRPAGPRYAPSIRQDARLRQAIARGEMHHAGSWQPADDPKVPKSTFINRSVKIVAANIPQKVLDENLRRSGFEVCNNTAAVLLVNFNYPTIPGSGHPLPVNQSVGAGGLSCPDNEIWVTSSIAGGIVTVFEGLPRPQHLRHA